MATLRTTRGWDGATEVTVTLTEHEAWHKARVIIAVEETRQPYADEHIKQNELLTMAVEAHGYRTLRADQTIGPLTYDGGLSIRVWDHAGNDDGWEDTYAEFFSSTIMGEASLHEVLVD